MNQGEYFIVFETDDSTFGLSMLNDHTGNYEFKGSSYKEAMDLLTFPEDKVKAMTWRYFVASKWEVIKLGLKEGVI
jgi:hypothetical protein